MSTGKTSEQKKEVCGNSRLETYKCNCSECTPFHIDAAQFLAGNGIREIIEKIQEAKEFFEELFEKGFEVVYIPEYEQFRLTPPMTSERKYWLKCPGCFRPFLLAKDNDPEGFCKVCAYLAESEEDGVKYYGDLFGFISLMLDMKRSSSVALGLVREFCDSFELNFKGVERRLHDTGGYEEIEVMLNSQFNIPWLEKMPTKRTQE